MLLLSGLYSGVYLSSSTFNKSSYSSEPELRISTFFCWRELLTSNDCVYLRIDDFLLILASSTLCKSILKPLLVGEFSDEEIIEGAFVCNFLILLNARLVVSISFFCSSTFYFKLWIFWRFWNCKGLVCLSQRLYLLTRYLRWILVALISKNLLWDVDFFFGLVRCFVVSLLNFSMRLYRFSREVYFLVRAS